MHFCFICLYAYKKQNRKYVNHLQLKQQHQNPLWKYKHFFYCSLFLANQIQFGKNKFIVWSPYNRWYFTTSISTCFFFPLHFFSCFIRRYAWNSIKVGNLFSFRFISSIQLRSIDGCQFILKFLLNQHIMMKIIWLWYGTTVKNGSVTKNRILKPKIAYWYACID